VIVVVVMPSIVMETSLTTVLVEPPSPDPDLAPADCDDDVSDVEEVADADGVADVDDAAVEEAADATVDGDIVTAALADAIALIDMKTSPEADLGRNGGCALSSASTCRACKAGAAPVKNSSVTAATNRRAARCNFFPSVQGIGASQRGASPHGWMGISSHVRVSWSAAGEFLRAKRDQ